MTDPKPTLAQKILAKQGVPVPPKDGLDKAVKDYEDKMRREKRCPVCGDPLERNVHGGCMRITVPAKAAAPVMAPESLQAASSASDAPEVDQKSPKGTAAKPKGRLQMRGRLPHAAHIEMDYDAVTKTWTGFFLIEGRRFTIIRATGVIPFFRMGDRQYRESLPKPVDAPEGSGTLSASETNQPGIEPG